MYCYFSFPPCLSLLSTFSVFLSFSPLSLPFDVKLVLLLLICFFYPDLLFPHLSYPPLYLSSSCFLILLSFPSTYLSFILTLNPSISSLYTFLSFFKIFNFHIIHFIKSFHSLFSMSSDSLNITFFPLSLPFLVHFICFPTLPAFSLFLPPLCPAYTTFLFLNPLSPQILIAYLLQFTFFSTSPLLFLTPSYFYAFSIIRVLHSFTYPPATCNRSFLLRLTMS